MSQYRDFLLNKVNKASKAQNIKVRHIGSHVCVYCLICCLHTYKEGDTLSRMESASSAD